MLSVPQFAQCAGGSLGHRFYAFRTRYLKLQYLFSQSVSGVKWFRILERSVFERVSICPSESRSSDGGYVTAALSLGSISGTDLSESEWDHWDRPEISTGRRLSGSALTGNPTSVSAHLRALCVCWATQTL